MCTGLYSTGARQLGEILRFDIIMDGLKIPCGITEQALQTLFSGNPPDPFTSLDVQGGPIELLASRLIDSKRFEQDGSVLIRAEDLVTG
jgi:hypothetical protein